MAPQRPRRKVLSLARGGRPGKGWTTIAPNGTREFIGQICPSLKLYSEACYGVAGEQRETLPEKTRGKRGEKKKENHKKSTQEKIATTLSIFVHGITLMINLANGRKDG